MDVLINQNKYDKTLLMDIDLPWQEDPLREHPTMREEIKKLHVNELSSKNISFKLITGIDHQRLENAKINLMDIMH